MTSDDERAIEQDCAKLVMHYANLNDAADWESLAALFTVDGRLARPTAPDIWIEGREAILTAFAGRPARKTRHLIGNVVITVRGENDATGECAIALFLSATEFRVGSFYDRFARTSEGWRFTERSGRLTF